MTMTQAPCKPSMEPSNPTKLHLDPAMPFAIGLHPLSAQDFLQIDDDLLPYRRAKTAHYEKEFDHIYMAEPDTLASQIEVEKLIRDNLIRFHSNRYAFENDTAVCGETMERFERNADMPIASTALLIPDDLVLMRRDDRGWRLVAASLCFPSSWNLGEKFSLPLEAVHGPVPLSDKMSMRINRIFDSLQPDIPVWRANWTLESDGELRKDKSEARNQHQREKLSGNVHFRTEFQTLHKLPETQDILFTIRIKVRPITTLLYEKRGRQKLAILHRQYMAMSDAERDYKGINHNADGLLKWLVENGME